MFLSSHRWINAKWLGGRGGRGAVNQGCMATYIIYKITAANSMWSLMEKVSIMHTIQRCLSSRSRDEETGLFLGCHILKPGCSAWSRRVTCFTGQPAVQQRFSSVPLLSLLLRHRQRPDAVHGREDYICTSKCECPRQAAVAKRLSLNINWF